MRCHPGNVLELHITVWVLVAFPGLARRLQAVVELCQQVAEGALADPMSLVRQFLDQPRRALAGPAQRRLRIATRCRFNERIQIPQQRRVQIRQPLAPTALSTNTRLAALRG